ncbi:MAG: mitofusin [Peltula sp. TS41687]|nr:MAG: mitofusin [Peltula sp. TS41687]
MLYSEGSYCRKDQQPCTSIFCEVLDARENAGIEEVQAVHKDVVYNRFDESTYHVYRLSELEKIVVDNDRRLQVKVYVKDIRSVEETLLNNGVVDMSLIDAPGLNTDSLKTHAVFAREEEIDVVVFAVSAANHFTLSAKEYIWNAARKKAYIFIVVNGFDMIRDKGRCQRMILEQVNSLSPRTFKESAELVHFVFSNALPVMSPPPLTIEGGRGSGGSSPDDDHDDNSDGDHDDGKGKHASASTIGAGDTSTISRLAPAKTYLMNVLGDLKTLATVNRDVASELDRVTRGLEELEPIFERAKKAQAEVSEEIDRSIEQTCSEIYDHCRTSLIGAISCPPGNVRRQSRGCLSRVRRACSTTNHSRCIKYQRSGTLTSRLAEYTDMTLRPEIIFRTRRDILARQVDTPVEIWDFFDLTGFLQRQEKVPGTGMAMTVVGVLGSRTITGGGGIGWMDGILGAARIFGHGGARNIHHLILPGLLLTGIRTSTSFIQPIPRSLSRRLSNKIQTSLHELDYAHVNAHRLSTKVRSIQRTNSKSTSPVRGEAKRENGRYHQDQSEE